MAAETENVHSGLCPPERNRCRGERKTDCSRQGQALSSTGAAPYSGPTTGVPVQQQAFPFESDEIHGVGREAWVPVRHETDSSGVGARDHQVGGSHYGPKEQVQPIDLIFALNLGFVEGNVVKYVCRWQDKGGTEDLRKARHYIDMLIEYEEQKVHG